MVNSFFFSSSNCLFCFIPSILLCVFAIYAVYIDVYQSVQLAKQNLVFFQDIQ